MLPRLMDVTWGSTVSTGMVRRLLLSAPSALVLPALSLKLPLAKLIWAAVVLLVDGVNTALRVKPVPVMALKRPPLTNRSPLLPSH